MLVFDVRIKGLRSSQNCFNTAKVVSLMLSLWCGIGIAFTVTAMHVASLQSV